MSFLEIATIIQTIRSAVFTGAYAWWAWGAAGAGRFDGPEGLVLLGKGLFIFIVATVVAGIILQVIAIVITIALDQESRPGDLDERDRMIERRALQHGFTFIGFGFVGAVLALWWGHGAVLGFHVMLAGFTLADFAVNTSKFVSYAAQRG